MSNRVAENLWGSPSKPIVATFPTETCCGAVLSPALLQYSQTRWWSMTRHGALLLTPCVYPRVRVSSRVDRRQYR